MKYVQNLQRQETRPEKNGISDLRVIKRTSVY